MKEIYEPKFVETLFDNMSGSYAYMNYITSFGFSERWRKRCVEELHIEDGKVVVDLMTGMGECWKHVFNKNTINSQLIAVDFSAEMIKHAENNKLKFPHSKITVLKEDVFHNSIESESADYIISGFGLKTFNAEQINALANEIDRLLKPNGTFSLIDVSVPKNNILKPFYMFYLKKVVPLLGKLFLGSPETYKMLGIYTEAFGNSKNAFQIFKRDNFEVEYINYFYGCATGIKGRKIK
ncbi:demethylmenaquinone methyltransferase/2-methoxy-6-polyprenyl-1,4-benzoquinol methylase [Winogradskyella pacifica]|uniref:Demethylmenaquinone methyltransferase/2-methoxy-6-polyprenyl-1,4-benzoquinol methylase n=1 Tax=Winogradskyella pacifica TaxID=664642 RepID=A0A3D9N700_9FLAO|nr:class I SAM-dependent methyltransferase [Winogradskyella pacifica]REE27834.1 demethylmenaquinone methyltransferase/2-methoxy-6-polyprenyl-1,4-benzoquinol methylase [Winogradskyella pacifica]